MNTGESGFLGTLRLVGFAIGVAAAFIALPEAYQATWPWVSKNVLGGYGPTVLSWAPLFWKVLLAVLIYSASRAVLTLVFTAGGLVVAVRLVARRWRD